LLIFLGMNLFRFLLICLTINMLCSAVFAQNSDEARALVKAGIQLNNDKKYLEAVDKFKQALKIDTGYLYADFELAFTLFNADKGMDGLPYLNKVLTQSTSMLGGAYDLLGSIYDKDKQTDKAITAYQAGIKAKPDFQRLYYNLGIVYFRTKRYPEAERCAIEAIKLEPTHASSTRMYALVCFHQNKRAEALLGLCSFILLEPQTAPSAEAFGNIQHILQGGALKPEPGDMAPHPIDANTIALNQAITLGITDAAKKKFATPAELLTEQLKNIFTNIGQLTEKQTASDFFRNYYAAYFYKLAQSGNMPAFAHLISASLNKDDYAKWIAAHSKEVADLDAWMKGTARSF
jgi:tetratricopeptide (TPR) repeat protein